jgi:hypothetical protein
MLGGKKVQEKDENENQEKVTTPEQVSPVLDRHSSLNGMESSTSEDDIEEQKIRENIEKLKNKLVRGSKPKKASIPKPTSPTRSENL